MITKITGQLMHVSEGSLTLAVGAMEYQVLIPDVARQRLQQQVEQEVSLHTIQYFDGNPQGKMVPRLVGFLSDVEREFFELFCSVDGVGVKKALRAMVRPVREIAHCIEQQDVKGMSALPGIGPAVAERIIAKLRRKMGKFALIVEKGEPLGAGLVAPDMVSEAFEALVSLGYQEAEARRLVDGVLARKRKFKSTQEILMAIYDQQQEG